MVYGNNLQQQHPMTSIPREMQISQNAPMHQPSASNQQADIINLSYNQRDIQMPHPDLPQQMGLYPTIAPQNLQHNHVMQSQQQQTLIEQTEVQEQQIQPNINIQYNIENADANADISMQAENASFSAEGDRDTSNTENAGEIPAQSKETPTEEIKGEEEEEEEVEEEMEDEEEDEDGTKEGKQTEEEKAKKQPEVDPNQCRVCKNTESLIDIFAIEDDMRICDIIMKMCSKIRIHERDYLPHMICLPCVGRLRIGYQFIKDVVATDAELRAKLTRHKRARKPNEGVVIIDCNEFTDSDNYDQNDDDDYQISNEEEEPDDDFETGSDSDSAKRVKIPKKRGPKPKNKVKKIKQELATTAKRLKRDIVFIEADDSSEEKAKKTEKCKECGKAFSSQTALRMHKFKAHGTRKQPTEDDTPFKCKICSRGFKYSTNLSSHMQMHKESYACDECGRVFALKSDAKKHALNSHKCSLSYECNKCRRLYTSVKRYQKHRESCSDYSSSSIKKEKKMIKVKEEVSYTGRDLFKSVAPPTTTYWSDSFSD